MQDKKTTTSLKLLPGYFTEESIKVQGLGLALECLSHAFRFFRESHALGHLGDAELRETAKEMLDYFPALLQVLAEYCEDRKDCLDSYVEDLEKIIKDMKQEASPDNESREAQA